MNKLTDKVLKNIQKKLEAQALKEQKAMMRKEALTPIYVNDINQIMAMRELGISWVIISDELNKLYRLKDEKRVDPEKLKKQPTKWKKKGWIDERRVKQLVKMLSEPETKAVIKQVAVKPPLSFPALSADVKVAPNVEVRDNE